MPGAGAAPQSHERGIVNSPARAYGPRMSTERARRRAAERVRALADANLAAEELRRAAVAELRRAIGFDRWCFVLADPVSLMPVGGVAETDFFPALPRMVELEQLGDPTSKHRLARSASATAALSALTRGDLARSRRWDECLRPFGIGDALTSACRDQFGCWGWIEANRDAADTPFDDDDAALFDEVSGDLARALRRDVAHGGPAVAGAPPAPGVVIVDEALRTTSWTPAAREWLDIVPGADLYRAKGLMPSVLYAVAGRLRAARDADVAALPGRVALRTATGVWATVDGALMEGAGAGQVALTIRASTPDEVLERLARAYALTARERELLTLVVEGLGTERIAGELFISPHTVKDHLKAVFDKVGVHSRPELVAQVLGRPAQAARAGSFASASRMSSTVS
jgi:DNA-binding CsgD family transcriptional regulator